MGTPLYFAYSCRAPTPCWRGAAPLTSRRTTWYYLRAKKIKQGQRWKERIFKSKLQKLVLDEIGLAIQLGFLEEEELISVLEDRLGSIDVILTGPAIPPKVIAMADQVTELRCSK